MRDLSEHFDWRDEDGTATSETFDPHIVATVTDSAVSVEVGSAMVVVDNHGSVEVGKRVATELLRSIFELDARLSAKGIVPLDDARAQLFARDVLEGVANTQEKGT